MDVLAFVTAWFGYLLAFALGMLVAWLVVRQFVPATNGRDAIDDAVARRTGARPGDDDAFDDDYDEEYEHARRSDDTIPMEVRR